MEISIVMIGVSSCTPLVQRPGQIELSLHKRKWCIFDENVCEPDNWNQQSALYQPMISYRCGEWIHFMKDWHLHEIPRHWAVMTFLKCYTQFDDPSAPLTRTFWNFPVWFKVCWPGCSDLSPTMVQELLVALYSLTSPNSGVRVELEFPAYLEW
jgi:hypothetical protein